MPKVTSYWTHAARTNQRAGRVRRRRRGRRLLPPGDHLGRHRLHGRPGCRALAGQPGSDCAESRVFAEPTARSGLHDAEASVGPTGENLYRWMGGNHGKNQRGRSPAGRVDRQHRCGSHGWVRTRRDSKGGFSFLELNDGSSLRAISRSWPTARWPTTKVEVKQLAAGCSVTRRGRSQSLAGQGAGH